ncbi:hypothetical protein PUV54_03515 [Hyphococcus flavus]|uniref:Uncharacterized protein n=1 Tax=Hyphococcus flavus TaxID=1866326 RepID=A0AAE9ZCF8_9PROT|nr:hypothetical protein [Hyphococcus flavus]WDI32259.1 hypothetical protein PUV54_03515 [Hyphococcus flavus]
MAVTTHPADYAAAPVKVGPKTAMTALYVVIGLAAMAIAIPAALATGAAEPGVFDECYSACATATPLASQ